MVNRENVLKVADAIENHSIKWLGFNMDMWIGTGLRDRSKHNCGTVACLGGWIDAVRLKNVQEENVFQRIGKSDKATARFLGISYGQASELFYPLSPLDDAFNAYNATPRQAVRVLRYLAKTGKVDWGKAGKP